MNFHLHRYFTDASKAFAVPPKRTILHIDFHLHRYFTDASKAFAVPPKRTILHIDFELHRYFTDASKAFAVPPKRTILHIDFETYSEADLRKVGSSVYARHPSTEVLMLAYATRKGEVKQWVAAAGEPMPDDLRRALDDPSVTIAAWNAPFEMAILRWTMGLEIPTPRFLDVMALAYSLALPGSLEKCGEVIGLPEDKQKQSRGKALIRRFCVPRKPTANKPHTRCTAETDPEEWEEFLEYNRQDVEAERTIYRRIKPWQMPDHEWRLWALDQKINKAGIPINIGVVSRAEAIYKATVKKDLAEMRDLTGLANPNSNQQLLPWLKEAGYRYNDLKKGHITRAAEEMRRLEKAGLIDMLDCHPNLLRVLELRARVSKASVKKFATLAGATDADGNLRDCHQFAGAGRTWRWAGRRFQPQNLSKPSPAMEDFIVSMAPEYLPKLERVKIGFTMLTEDIANLSIAEFWEKYDHPTNPEINTMEALVAAVRPVVQAPEDMLLADADLSAIENVVLGWVAQDEKILRVFREGLDPYIDFATDMFGMTYEAIEAEVKAGNKKMRTTAKPGVLGCGYLLGPGREFENEDTGEIEATGLLGYAWNMGVKDFTLDMSQLSVNTFRSKFDRVKAFWYEIEAAAIECVLYGFPTRAGKYIRFDMSGPFLRMHLPSGRCLHYWRPQVRNRMMPWGKEKPQLSYQQIEKNQWRRVTTHPGKLTENAVQAIARDLLGHAMMLADKRGLDLRLHVHDQAIALTPKLAAAHLLKVLIQCLTTLPDWADETLPLKAAGHTSPVFIKD